MIAVDSIPVNKAWNFIFERARPFSFCKGTSIRESLSQWETFKGAPRPRPGATQAMTFVACVSKLDLASELFSFCKFKLDKVVFSYQGNQACYPFSYISPISNSFALGKISKAANISNSLKSLYKTIPSNVNIGPAFLLSKIVPIFFQELNILL